MSSSLRLPASALCFAALLLLMLLLGAATPARADTAISLYKSYAGNLNFVGTQRTLRTGANGTGTGACAVTAAGTTVTAAVAGIPTSAVVVSAQLYWAGSGSTPDYDILFEGAAVSASPVRQFTSATVGYNYFSGAADVTAQVKAKRNGTYSFSGLTVENGSPYCAVEGVLGGFSLLVIYSLPTETFRVLNLYEGFKYIQNTVQVPLTLTNFKIPTPLPATSTGRVAHITWEGDKSISGGGEDLLFNNIGLVDGTNTSGNQFNSASNINGDLNSHGVDFDAYTLTSQIAAGQTSATTLYKSGQDLVLLSAEVVAVPNVPVTDLELLIGVSGIISRGQTITWTHTINSLGPSTESGPVKLTQTLPTGMSYVSGSGTSWSCSVSGQIVTCIYTGSTAPGASIPALNVKAKIATNSPDTMSTSATVEGAQFDNYLSNNTASKSVTIAASNYIFTNKPCVTGLPFSELGCAPIVWDTRVAGTTSPVYITAVDGGGIPFNPKLGAVTFQFAFSCHDPITAVTRGVFDGQQMPQCAGGGTVPTTFLSRSYSFSGLSPSVGPYNLSYADVGKMEMFLKSPLGTFRSEPFVYIPYDLVLTSLTANPAASVSGPGVGVYVKAGAPFSLRVQAVNLQGVAAPNFGKEQASETVKLNVAAAGPSSGAVYADMSELPDILGAFVPFSNGMASGTNFTWNEVGILSVNASIGDGNYLGAGDVEGNPVRLGRFVPDHFDTEVPIVMSCPTELSCNGTGMHYSSQPIGSVVTARGAADVQMKNYQGVFAKQVTLSAASASGAASAPAAGALTGPLLPAPPPAPTIAAATWVQGVAGAAPLFTLPARTAPTHVYLRATDTDNVTSLRTIDTEEGGTKVALGRLQISNEFGSELLPLKVTASVQYYGSTSRWQNSGTDSLTTFGSTLKSTSLAPNPALVVTLTADTPTTLLMNKGALSFRVQSKNKDAGRADINFTPPSWLPSAGGRMTFGTARSTPVIYIREIF